MRLSAGETRKLVPGLKKEGLTGGLLFDEYWVDAVQLVQANVDSALRAGAQVITKTDVIGLSMSPGRGSPSRGVRLRRSDGHEETVRGSVVINAAGPWAGRVAGLAGAEVPLRLQKGSHLVYKNIPTALGVTPVRIGLLLEAVDRERYVFILPGQGKMLVGPTDIPEKDGPDHLKTTAEEIRSLLGSCRRYFPSFPDQYDATTVGARPLLGQKGPEKLLSRGFA
ncbi:MAG: FAD-dependent oxidoreductase [Elusimicrobia bacterium]|nr:FAD-dependent oxidoreductase [Elusimicrobiota bacterium]